jgi:hypothetical protein
MAIQRAIKELFPPDNDEQKNHDLQFSHCDQRTMLTNATELFVTL